MADDPPAKKVKMFKPTPKYTKAFTFTASMLVSVAAKDISRRAKNMATSAERARCKAADTEPPDTPMERYAFHPGDLRNAAKPSDVLRRAGKRAKQIRTFHRQKNRASYGWQRGSKQYRAELVNRLIDELEDRGLKLVTF